jgi:hypothetical protein
MSRFDKDKDADGKEDPKKTGGQQSSTAEKRNAQNQSDQSGESGESKFNLDEVVPFKKYKGKTWRQLMEGDSGDPEDTDPRKNFESYLGWIVEESRMNDTTKRKAKAVLGLMQSAA